MFKNVSKKQMGIGAMVIFISLIFVQSLFFKFTGAPETEHIFGTLNAWAENTFGIENLFLPPGPFNAYVIGSAELVTSAILLIGFFTGRQFMVGLGGLMATGIMTGAISFHLFTPLGIVVEAPNVESDSGALFAMACLIWTFGLTLAYLHKNALLGVVCGKHDKTKASV